MSNGPHHKTRAVILAAIMLCSVVAGGIGFAGNAGASQAGAAAEDLTAAGDVTAQVDVSPSELSGSGIDGDPYIITNASELQAMEDDLDAHYRLGNDIDASNTSQWNGGKGFDPVGNDTTQFTGSLDGSDHAITGLTIDRPNERAIGIFGYSQGTITNVSLTSISITGEARVGGLVGENKGSIQDVVASGSVTLVGSLRDVGGLVGENYDGVIENVTASVSVEGSDRVGGLVGENGGTIRGATATGDVTGNIRIGGLVGENEDFADDGTIRDSTASGSVNATGSGTAGGLVGINKAGTIIESTASGDVTSDGSYLGGLVGENRDGGRITDAAASGSVDASGGFVGGLVGNNKDGFVTNATASASVTSGGDVVGGLVGNNINGTLQETFAVGSVTGSGTVGGLVGQNEGRFENGTVADSYWDTQTTGQSTSAGSATGLTASEMQGQAAETNMTGLSFGTAWQTRPNDYPALLAIDQPNVRDDSFTTAENTTRTVSVPGVLGNDSDPNGDSLTAAIVSGPTNGTVTFDADGSFEYTPNRGFTGTDSFTYNASDGTFSDTATVTITVTSANDPPRASDDSYATSENDNLTVSAPGVLRNDSDPNGDGLSAGLVTSPTNGTLMLDTDGSFEYAPNQGYNGTDSFTYNASDGTLSDTATVTITVSGSNENDSQGTAVSLSDLSGNGTEGDPYIITNASELQAVEGDLDADYRLGNDINASNTSSWNSGRGFDPIGSNTTTFSGTLDGGGHDITGLTIDRTENNLSAPAGLFARIGSSARIKDLDLVQVSIATNRSLGSHGFAGDNLYGVGALAGENKGTVEDISVTGRVSGAYDVGGLIGISDGSVKNVSASATVVGTNGVGGLIGTVESGGIVADVALRDPTVLVYRADENDSLLFRGIGGLTGRLNDGSRIENVNATVNVTVTRSSIANLSEGVYVGGLVGASGGTITDVHTSGRVRGYREVGGVAGLQLGNITNASSDVTTVGVADVGGVTGQLNDGRLTNATSSGYIDGYPYDGIDQVRSEASGLGGLVGEAAGGTVRSASSSATINASYSSSAGGLIGSNGATLLDVAASGYVNATPSGSVSTINEDIGGLAGTNSGTIRNASASGRVEGAFGENRSLGTNRIGGLVGYNLGSIRNASATGRVSGSDNVGGLVGVSSGAIRIATARGDVNASRYRVGGLVGLYDPDSTGDTITNTSARGSVNGSERVGGLVGESRGSGINHSFAVGNVNGASLTGGVVGSISDDFDSSLESYWDVNTTGQDSTPGETWPEFQDPDGLQTSQMTGEAARTNMTELAFGTTWYTKPNDYPVLAARADPSTLFTITSASVTDNTDGNENVTTNDTIEVQADITGATDSVTANASAFGGPASLTLSDGNTDGTYNATFTVAATGGDGDYRINVTATNTDSTESAETNALRLDTDGPVFRFTNITDLKDQDGEVGGGDRVEINVTAFDTDSGLTSVQASASDFGVNSITLVETAAGYYEGTFTVDAANASSNGTYSVTGSATNGVGRTTTNTSSGLALNTTSQAPTDETEPVITNASITDFGNPFTDSFVNDGDRVRINVTVTDSGGSGIASVEADAAGFGAGTVALTDDDNDGVYNATFIVNGSKVSGEGVIIRPQITAIDGAGNSNSTRPEDSVENRVYLDTIPPEANVTANRTKIQPGDAIRFDATGSSDSSFRSLEEIRWDFDGDGTTEQSGFFSGNSKATYRFPSEGTYTTEINVSDDAGNTDTDTVTITVDSADSTDPTVSDPNLTDLTDGDGNVTDGDRIEATVTAADSGGSGLKSVRIDAGRFGAGSVSLSDGNDDGVYNGTFLVFDDTAGADGTVTPTFRAVDNAGNVATTTSPSLTLDTTAPVVDISANETTVSVGESIAFDASVSDTTAATNYLWEFGDGAVASGSAPNHTYDDSGTYTVELTVTDAVGQTNNTTTTISVTGINNAPTARNDSYTVNESTDRDLSTLDVSAPGVLSNDSDLDGDSLSASIVSGPTNGTLSLATNGSLSYTPDQRFTGTDSFTYEASDGSLTDTATVTITVTETNQAPTARNDSYTVSENATLTVSKPGVLDDDSDPDGDSLTAAVVSAPDNGTLSLAANGSLSYTPAPGFNGSDSFTYETSDGQLNDTATVTITVTAANDAPIAVDDAYTTAENSTLRITAPGVLANDSDPNGDVLTATLVSRPTNGSLTFDADGSFNYTPESDFTGTDSFTYNATDGTLTDTATVTITVNSSDGNGSQRVDVSLSELDGDGTADAPYVITNASELQAMQDDLDANYTLGNDIDAAVTVDWRTPDGFVPIGERGLGNEFGGTFDGSNHSISGLFISQPAKGTVGLFGVINGSARVRDVTLVGVGVEGGNGVGGLVGVNSGGEIRNVSVSGSVTADGEESSGTAVGGVVGTSIGTVSDSDADVAVRGDDKAGGLVGQTTRNNENERGVVVDSYATGTVAANPYGDTAGSVYGNDFGGLVGENDGLVNRSHANSTVTGENVTSLGGLVGENSGGTVNNSYATGSVSGANNVGGLVGWNDGDVRNAYAVASLTAPAIDPFGDPTKVGGVVGQNDGTVTDSYWDTTIFGTSNGGTGLTTAEMVGEDARSNMSGLDFGPVWRTQPNDYPVLIDRTNRPAAVDETYTTTENATLDVTAPGVLENDSDPNGDTLTAARVSAPSNGSLSLAANGSFTYIPTPGFTGTDTFTYEASDGNLTDTATVTITVTATNRAPTVINDSYNTTENTTLAVPTPGILRNDTDPDGDPLTAAVESRPTNGTLILNGSGALSYTPDPGFTGTDAFTYAASDGQLNDTATVTITVTPTAPTDSTAPTLTSPSLADLTDGNGIVTDGDRVGAAVTVTDAGGSGLANVTVNASRFGVGSVLLTDSNDDGVYNGSFIVNATRAGLDGTVRPQFRAADTAGNQNATRGASLTLDTTAPGVSAVADTRTVTVGETVRFSVNAGDATSTITSYTWQLGDGTTASGPTVNHSYASSGTYAAEVTVTDSAGNADTSTIRITVETREQPAAPPEPIVKAPDDGRYLPSEDGTPEIAFNATGVIAPTDVGIEIRNATAGNGTVVATATPGTAAGTAEVLIPGGTLSGNVTLNVTLLNTTTDTVVVSDRVNLTAVTAPSIFASKDDTYDPTAPATIGTVHVAEGVIAPADVAVRLRNVTGTNDTVVASNASVPLVGDANTTVPAGALSGNVTLQVELYNNSTGRTEASARLNLTAITAGDNESDRGVDEPAPVVRAPADGPYAPDEDFEIGVRYNASGVITPADVELRFRNATAGNDTVVATAAPGTERGDLRETIPAGTLVGNVTLNVTLVNGSTGVPYASDLVNYTAEPTDEGDIQPAPDIPAAPAIVAPANATYQPGAAFNVTTLHNASGVIAPGDVGVRLRNVTAGNGTVVANNESVPVEGESVLTVPAGALTGNLTISAELYNSSADTTEATTVVTLTTGSGDELDAAPTASALVPPTARVNQSIELDARGSVDDGTITAYNWTITAPDGTTATRAGSLVTVTPAQTGSYEVALTVTDDAGQTDTVSRTIDVSRGPDAAVVTSGVSHVGGTQPDMANVSLRAEFSSGLLQLQFLNESTNQAAGDAPSDQYELDGLGADDTTRLRVTVTVANFTPRVLIGSANDVNWTRTRTPDGNWTITITGSPAEVHSYFDRNTSEPTWNGSLVATESQNQTITYAVDGLSTVSNESRERLNGSVFITDAQEFGVPRYNDTATPDRVELTVAAPHFETDGQTVNQGFFEAYLPPSLLEEWNVTAADLVGRFNGTRRTTTVSATPDGGARVSFNVTYSEGTAAVTYNDSGSAAPSITAPSNTTYDPTQPLTLGTDHDAAGAIDDGDVAIRLVNVTDGNDTVVATNTSVSVTGEVNTTVPPGVLSGNVTIATQLYNTSNQRTVATDTVSLTAIPPVAAVENVSVGAGDSVVQTAVTFTGDVGGGTVFVDIEDPNGNSLLSAASPVAVNLTQRGEPITISLNRSVQDETIDVVVTETQSSDAELAREPENVPPADDSTGGDDSDPTATSTPTPTTTTTTSSPTTSTTTSTTTSEPITTDATETTGSEAPGFGPLVSLVALLSAAVLALRRRTG